MAGGVKLLPFAGEVAGAACVRWAGAAAAGAVAGADWVGCALAAAGAAEAAGAAAALPLEASVLAYQACTPLWPRQAPRLEAADE